MDLLSNMTNHDYTVKQISDFGNTWPDEGKNNKIVNYDGLHQIWPRKIMSSCRSNASFFLPTSTETILNDVHSFLTR